MERNIQNFVTNNLHEMVYVNVGHSLILSSTNSHYWFKDHTSWALVELECRLKVFPSAYNLCFETHHTKVHSLVLIFWNLQAHVIYYEWSKSVIFPLRTCIFPSVCTCVGPMWQFKHVLRYFYMCSCIFHLCCALLHAKCLTKCSSDILCCIGLKWVPMLGVTLDWTCLPCFGQRMCVLHTVPNLCHDMPCTSKAHTRYLLGTPNASPATHTYTAHAQHMHNTYTITYFMHYDIVYTVKHFQHVVLPVFLFCF